MAEFTEVWDEWKRMCKHKNGNGSCRTCPLNNLDCNSEFPKDQNHYDGHAIEEIIMGWAEEHREPVYPLWFEWLEKIGVAGRAYDLEPYFMGDKEILPRTAAFTVKAFEPIPTDIAEKLGLEPKEV